MKLALSTCTIDLTQVQYIEWNVQKTDNVTSWRSTYVYLKHRSAPLTLSSTSPSYDADVSSLHIAMHS
jgi:hypothetical protein